ncbi:MAG TPA: VOC family protein [Candidatus Baltobacteraceae bacterium]|jgi:hypothetical protein|nr:VOC family protein [Candidatus Baltobacteraceae bacterium]
MSHRTEISRCLFLTWTGGAIFCPSQLFAKNENMVPSNLDHILLGTYELQRGIDFVKKRTGVRAQFGGVHPGRGTQNALLSLGGRRYLEIIAPDPAQPHVKNRVAKGLRSLQGNALLGWAAHVDDLSVLADRLRAVGVIYSGPTPGSRKRPDGGVLEWKTLELADTASDILPFFIEWAPGTIHPSVDAPKGCSLARFSAETPDSKQTITALKALGLDLSVSRGSPAETIFRCVVEGPKGKLEVNSTPLLHLLGVL